MIAEFAEAFVLIVRGALIAGLCWGAWLCLGEQTPAERPAGKAPYQRFATFALLVVALTALGGLLPAG